MNKHHPYKKFITGLQKLTKVKKKKPPAELIPWDNQNVEETLRKRTEETCKQLGVPPRVFQGPTPEFDPLGVPLPIIHSEFIFDPTVLRPWRGGGSGNYIKQKKKFVCPVCAFEGEKEVYYFAGHDYTCESCHFWTTAEGMTFRRNEQERLDGGWGGNIVFVRWQSILGLTKRAEDNNRHTHPVPEPIDISEWARLAKRGEPDSTPLFGNVDALQFVVPTKALPKDQQSTNWLIFADWLEEHGHKELADEHRRQWG